jgi:serine/threonine protein kinase
VKRAFHKKTLRECAVKVVKKKELNLKDLELLKREIEVLKVCQHPYIIKLEDVFENYDYLYIVMEYLTGGDFFGFLEKRKFRLSEDNARRIAH